ncbi:hypothetical protein PR048_018057 [Dryococelus australis]|uniref:Uncharacterized protein n=1 Tax=Dryococelus australis TaxID=614101 RepID=A0ABQ9HBS9_9NEOP|nr:hypothetical protein PR048_018057 [Dryococelus australis]
MLQKKLAFNERQRPVASDIAIDAKVRNQCGQTSVQMNYVIGKKILLVFHLSCETNPGMATVQCEGETCVDVRDPSLLQSHHATGGLPRQAHVTASMRWRNILEVELEQDFRKAGSFPCAQGTDRALMLKVPIYLEQLSSFRAEKPGIYKGDTTTCIKCASPLIVAGQDKRRALIATCIASHVAQVTPERNTRASFSINTEAGLRSRSPLLSTAPEDGKFITNHYALPERLKRDTGAKGKRDGGCYVSGACAHSCGNECRSINNREASPSPAASRGKGALATADSLSHGVSSELLCLRVLPVINGWPRNSMPVKDNAVHSLQSHTIPFTPTVANCLRVAQEAVSLLGSHQGEPGSIPGRATPGSLYVEIRPDDAIGQRVFSGISRFPCSFILALLHTHLNHPHRLSIPRC